MTGKIELHAQIFIDDTIPDNEFVFKSKENNHKSSGVIGKNRRANMELYSYWVNSDTYDALVKDITTNGKVR